jgi:hypothetical protein
MRSPSRQETRVKPTRTIVSVRYVLSTISVNLTGPRLGHRTELQKLIRLDPRTGNFRRPLMWMKSRRTKVK